MLPELPQGLGPTFSVADALQAGVTPARLRRADLARPFRGVRTEPRPPSAANTTGAGDSDPISVFDLARNATIERALHFSVVMLPHQFFTHVTAAILWGVWLPAQLLQLHDDLDVGVYTPLRHPRRAGVTGHQVRRGLVNVVTHPKLGVRLVSPSSAWAQLATVLRDPYDLVAAGDAVVREQMFADDPPTLASLAQLNAAVTAGRRVGVGALRLALPRVRTRSASRPETHCRLMIIDAGMPEPQLNWNVRDDGGTFFACVDLAYPDLKIAVEYEGEYHLIDPVQWAKDIARHERLIAHGWIVIRVTKMALDLHPSDPQSVVARVRAARSVRGAL